MDLNKANASRWQNMHIPADKGRLFKMVADKINLHKDKYKAVSARTGVPWEVIGVIHYRESSLNFNTYLGNGEPLNRKTTLVPKNRGPFSSWEEGAIDALVSAPPKAALNKDWSIGGTLEIIERYNGLGYAGKGIPSPYVWAGTDQYTKGKYVADGRFDPNYIDTQLGCAGILKFLGYKKATVPAAGTVLTTATGGLGLWLATKFGPVSAFVHDHWVGLLAGAVVLGIAIDLVIKFIKRK